MGNDLRRRLKTLEGRTSSMNERRAQIERDAADFTARIETISRNADPARVVEAFAFRDCILKGGDPFLLQAFRFVEHGDWKL